MLESKNAAINLQAIFELSYQSYAKVTPTPIILLKCLTFASNRASTRSISVVTEARGVEVNHLTEPYQRSINSDEQQLYDHWLQLSQSETPTQLIDRFSKLLLEGSAYSDPTIQAIVQQLTRSSTANVEFKFVLNRCCYILVNRWLLQPRLQPAIPQFLSLFEPYLSAPTYSRSHSRQRELIRVFTQTEEFALLRRLGEMLHQEDTLQSRPLSSYIRRYPYLYEYHLLSDKSSDDQRRTVRQIQAQTQRQFELDLSQYITHRLVRSPHNQTPHVVKNPTLLSDRDLSLALRQFICKVDGLYTQRDLAQHFLTYSRQTSSFRVFKDDLFQYLTPAVSPDYGNRQFYDRLHTLLRNTLPQNDAQPPNEFLLLRTSSRLLNFLIVESSQQPNHFVFLDLIGNIGTTFAINLLLKIVLISHKVKPHLEKRFAILFHHYAAQTKQSEIGWLVESLETLNVALTTNFGSVNFHSNRVTLV